MGPIISSIILRCIKIKGADFYLKTHLKFYFHKNKRENIFWERCRPKFKWANCVSCTKISKGLKVKRVQNLMGPNSKGECSNILLNITSKCHYKCWKCSYKKSILLPHSKYTTWRGSIIFDHLTIWQPYERPYSFSEWQILHNTCQLSQIAFPWARLVMRKMSLIVQINLISKNRSV